jgi:hypothetical protein
VPALAVNEVIKIILARIAIRVFIIFSLSILIPT